MMRRLLICFSCTLAVSAGIVTGRVTINGNSASKIPADAVVWLEASSPRNPEPLDASVRATLIQKNKTFQPHVLPIQVNTLVDFPNFDPIFHNAFSNYDGQIFDIGLYPPGSTRAVRFRRPGVVRIFCNIHPAMSAVILVLNTPYFTTVKLGSYTIPNVAPGTYGVHVFEERATSNSEEFAEITVGSLGVEQVPEIHLSEAGYVKTPHKNKYGQNYPPESDSYGNGGPPK